MIKDENFKTLQKGLNKLNIDWDEDKLELIKDYLRYLLQENRRHNLIGTEEINKIITKHFLDCLAPVALPEIKEMEGPVLDLGTGAGLPGILWGIIKPDIDVYLLDSRRKKVDFLNNVRNRLELKNIYPLQERAEILGQNSDFREKFRLVTARAVADINILLEYSLPLTKISGKAIFFKGPAYKKELNNTDAVSKKLGGNGLKTKELFGPYLQADRYLLIVEKIESTSSKYPRETGVPKKRPL